ncbi:MAG: EutN/CcmL family microcompartment protein [Planctomycetaceae bacterium]|jgi:ethanolamine utilization protein EutN
MRIGEVIGKVTLSRVHPSLRGATWLVTVPLSLPGLKGEESGRGEPIVVYDEWGAGTGSKIAISEGGEAAAPFLPNQKPVDAYNAALLDTVELL